MKKKIKVYLQYPLGISDSQYYKSLLENSPDGIEYINPSRKTGMISSKKYFYLFNFLKQQIRFWSKKFNIGVPNAHLSPPGDYDIIHCAHCLSKNNDKPWVLDVESLWQLWVSGRIDARNRMGVLEYLKKDNCKKIIAWTEATRRNIIKFFPEIKNKVELLYYATPFPNYKPKKSEKDLVLFFSGRHFYSKGGLHATEAIDRLIKKYPNVRGVINGAIPENIIKEYSRNKKIEFHQLMPYKDVLNLYKKADIFVYPGYSDSFGFIFMDAMMFGVPIVTVDGYARKEIVSNLNTGIIISRPAKINIKSKEGKIIDKIVEESSKLIENKILREEMSKECIKTIKDGKFSIRRRNKKLKRIYRESLT